MQVYEDLALLIQQESPSIDSETQAKVRQKHDCSYWNLWIMCEPPISWIPFFFSLGVVVLSVPESVGRLMSIHSKMKIFAYQI